MAYKDLEKRREQTRKYRKKYHEKILIQNQKYRENHPDIERERKKRWYLKNRVIKKPRVEGEHFHKDFPAPYATWNQILQRCGNPNIHSYGRYGGRGISVCNEWKEFRNFLKDMGERPKRFCIHRIDNNKGYFKENCCWMDSKGHARLHNFERKVKARKGVMTSRQG